MKTTEESLKSARNIHQLLILVCTIIAVLSMSITDNNNKYHDAIVKLEMIESKVDELLEKNLNSEIVSRNQVHYILDSTFMDYLKKVKQIYPVRKINKSLSSGHMSHNPNDRPGNMLKDLIQEDNLTIKIPFEEIGSKNSAYWLIRHKNLTDAKSTLLKKSDEYEKNLSSNVDVSGFRVAIDKLYWVGPVIILGLLFYLSSLTRHICWVSLDEKENVLKFPWMAVFPDICNKVISAISVSLYPFLVSLMIVSKSDIQDGVRDFLYILYGIVFFCFGSYLIYLFNKLRINSPTIER